MTPQSYIKSRSWAAVVACCGIALALGPVATHSKADEWNKRTVITIDRPLQVMDAYLEPGSYVFRLLDSRSDRHIVQIYNANENHLIATLLAVPDYRVQPTGKPAFRMWETPAGYVAALRSWFYAGQNYGEEFPYPKHLRQLEVAQVTPPPSPAPQAEPAPPPQEQAQVAPQPPVEEAQNTPPPAPPEIAQPETTPPPAPSTPAQLPQTASPYPLIGFIGTLLLGFGGLLRRTRSA